VPTTAPPPPPLLPLLPASLEALIGAGTTLALLERAADQERAAAAARDWPCVRNLPIAVVPGSLPKPSAAAAPGTGAAPGAVAMAAGAAAASGPRPDAGAYTGTDNGATYTGATYTGVGARCNVGPGRAAGAERQLPSMAQVLAVTIAADGARASGAIGALRLPVLDEASATTDPATVSTHSTAATLFAAAAPAASAAAAEEATVAAAADADSALATASLPPSVLCGGALAAAAVSQAKLLAGAPPPLSAPAVRALWCPRSGCAATLSDSWRAQCGSPWCLLLARVGADIVAALLLRTTLFALARPVQLSGVPALRQDRLIYLQVCGPPLSFVTRKPAPRLPAPAPAVASARAAALAAFEARARAANTAAARAKAKIKNKAVIAVGADNMSVSDSEVAASARAVASWLAFLASHYEYKAPTRIFMEAASASSSSSSSSSSLVSPVASSTSTSATIASVTIGSTSAPSPCAFSMRALALPRTCALATTAMSELVTAAKRRAAYTLPFALCSPAAGFRVCLGPLGRLSFVPTRTQSTAASAGIVRTRRTFISRKALFYSRVTPLVRTARDMAGRISSRAATLARLDGQGDAPLRPPGAHGYPAAHWLCAVLPPLSAAEISAAKAWRKSVH